VIGQVFYIYINNIIVTRFIIKPYLWLRCLVSFLSNMSSLSVLSALISSGVASIEAKYAENGAIFPSLDEPFRGSSPLDLEVMESAAVVIAAAGQLIASLRLPPVTVIDAATGV
jgi:hypothetical protein